MLSMISEISLHLIFLMSVSLTITITGTLSG